MFHMITRKMRRDARIVYFLAQLNGEQDVTNLLLPWISHNKKTLLFHFNCILVIVEHINAYLLAPKVTEFIVTTNINRFSAHDQNRIILFSDLHLFETLCILKYPFHNGTSISKKEKKNTRNFPFKE